MFGLAQHKHAPAVFKRTSRYGIPYLAVIAQSMWFLLGFMTLSSSASTVFTWFQSLTAASAIVGWIAICWVYLHFYYAMKKQGISRDELPWKAPFQPYAAWFSFTSFIIIILSSGYTVFLKGQ
jgi:yeast amino acid transporter